MQLRRKKICSYVLLRLNHLQIAHSNPIFFTFLSLYRFSVCMSVACRPITNRLFVRGGRKIKFHFIKLLDKIMFSVDRKFLQLWSVYRNSCFSVDKKISFQLITNLSKDSKKFWSSGQCQMATCGRLIEAFVT